MEAKSLTRTNFKVNNHNTNDRKLRASYETTGESKADRFLKDALSRMTSNNSNSIIQQSTDRSRTYGSNS
jgi:hypothetical protein